MYVSHDKRLDSESSNHRYKCPVMIITRMNDYQ